MRATILMLAVLVWVGGAVAQQYEGFEMPKQMEGKLGEKECPPGTSRDEKGWCTKTAEKPAPPEAAPAAGKVVPPAPAPPDDARPAATPPTGKAATTSGQQQAPAAGSPPAATRPPVRRPPPAPPPPAPAPAAATTPEETAPGASPAAGAQPAESPPPAAVQSSEAAAGQATTAPLAGQEQKPGEEEQGKGQEEQKRGQEQQQEEKPGREQRRRARFVKGELADFIGSNKLVTKNNRIGVRLGYRKLDLKHYATINPEADFRIWRFEIGLGVPLALEIFDGAWDESKDEPVGFANAGSLRSEDWNEPGEYLRFIRYLRLGHKEDHLFLNLSQYSSTTIGHGALMRRYNVNVDPDSTRLAFELDMYNDYAGFELVSNSLIDWDLFGVLGFIKPLSLFLDGTLARSLSLGVTYLADRHAPVSLATQQQPANPLYLLGDDRPQVSSSAFLHAVGVDMELKVVKTRSVDIKPYLDYSWFMPATPSGSNPPQAEGGGGFTLGVLGRFNFGSEPVHALRAIAEFRSFSSTYLPGYFDTFYEVQKFIANTRYSDYAGAGQLPPTKFSDVFVDRRGEGRHLGFYLELTYAVVDWAALTVALEGSDARSGNNFLAHLEVPALGWLQFFASYFHRGADSLGDIFTSGGDRIAFAAVRLRVLPFLFCNFRYHYTFELRDDFADLTGNGIEEHYRLYDKMHGWLADVELGWEF